jgi:23S rRNA pseudouridine1911/1915/1917 synthase
MIDLEIIYEDNHLIVINKPNGVLVHTDETGDRSLEDILKEYIKVRYNKPGEVYLAACHRLDRPVSGALIFAKTSKGLERMRKLFSDRLVRKTYLALSTQCPDPMEADLENWLYKDRVRNIVEVVKGKRDGAVQARTIYKTLGQVGRYWLVRLHPITGKSHQLRVHLKLVGAPIVGDVKYGGISINDPNALMLHCRQMEFVHPVQQVPVVLRAELPDRAIWRQYHDLISALDEQE